MAQETQPNGVERERLLQWLDDAGRYWRATAAARRRAPVHFAHEVRSCEAAARQCEETARLLRETTANLDTLAAESRRLRGELARVMGRLSEARRWVDLLARRLPPSPAPVAPAISEPAPGGAAAKALVVPPPAAAATPPSTPAPDRVIVRCSACSAKLSLPAGKTGRVRCPVCRALFEAWT